MDENKANQANQSSGFIHDLEVDLVDLYTAKNDIKRKTKSNHIHHVGAEAQQLFEQAEAIKRNGVAKQWIMQVKLAIAPIKSDFCFNTAIINTESYYFPQHLLNLTPLPQGHGLLRPTLS